MALKRRNVKAILANEDLRRKLMVSTIQATQAREGIETTAEQAGRAYYVVVESEKATGFPLRAFRGTAKSPERREEFFVRSLRGDPDARAVVRREDFRFIEGAPLIFDSVALVGHLFRESPKLGTFATSHQGVTTRDDTRFIRYWWEVAPRRDDRPWVALAKGGEFSRFYSDAPLSIDWSDEAQRLFWRRRDPAIYFKRGLTWPRANHVFNVRRLPERCVFADKGPGLFAHDEDKNDVLLALLNSELVWFLLTLLNKYDHWEMRSLDLIPLPALTPSSEIELARVANVIHDAKATWDKGNEVSTRFSEPWLVSHSRDSASLSSALDRVLKVEVEQGRLIHSEYCGLNDAVYLIYGVKYEARKEIERRLTGRPDEVVWPQMQGKSVEQKRMEHVWRLLSYAVKRVVEADDDGVVPFGSAGGDAPLIDRVRNELAALFPGRDESQLEVEIVNELKRGAKGYRKCASLQDWLANAFFEYHAGLYKSRPIFWHLASAQGTAPFAFGALVHYHRFDKNRLAKLRASYLRDTIEELRREAGLADKAGRSEDRIDLQEKLEQAQAFDKRLQLVQEGHHDGPEGSDHDFRILTPWKEPSARSKSWSPDLDDGVKVNIAPLERAGVLRVSGVAG